MNRVGSGSLLYRASVLVGLSALLVSAGPGRAADGDAWAVGTFESLGLYYNPAAGDAGECRMSYRPAGPGRWWEGLPLTYDPRERQYRGSIVGLAPGTAYEVRLEGGGRTVTFEGRTRSDRFPIGKTTYLDHGRLDQTVHVTESGTPDGYHLITPRPGGKTVVNVFNQSDHSVRVSANYVIIRGLELINAATHAVMLDAGVHDVVIEDNHITFWGRVGGPRTFGNIDVSDRAINADPGVERITIQRNLIEHPRGGSSDWDYGHASGPGGIYFRNARGGIVIRYNEMHSTEEHGYADVIGGGDNFSFEGSPNRDSDYYGNVLSHSYDDVIEAEGAGMNVRIWGNYLHHGFNMIAVADVSMGPLYVFRNVFGYSRIGKQDQVPGNAIKTGYHRRMIDGTEVLTGLGRLYVFHNTALQPGGVLNMIGSSAHNTMTRNNIFYGHGRSYPLEPVEPPNDFDHDLTGSMGVTLANVGDMFVPSQRLEWFLTPSIRVIKWGTTEVTVQGETFRVGDMALPRPNPALDTGVRIPNFNDGYQGSAPDIGAFENGNPPLRFGREAAPEFTRAPWERY